MSPNRGRMRKIGRWTAINQQEQEVFMEKFVRQRYPIRLSSQERELLEQIAAAEAVKPSEAVRLAIREAARLRHLWPRVAKEEQHG